MNNKIDSKHLLFHVLVSVYFIWAVIFSALIGMAIANLLSKVSAGIATILDMWLLVNLVMGTTLYMVIRIFRKKTVLLKAIRWSYFILALSASAVVIIGRV